MLEQDDLVEFELAGVVLRGHIYETFDLLSKVIVSNEFGACIFVIKNELIRKL